MSSLPAMILLGSRLPGSAPLTFRDHVLSVRAQGIRVIPATLAPAPRQARVAAEVGGIADLWARAWRARGTELRARRALQDPLLRALLPPGASPGTAARLGAALAEVVRANAAKHVHAHTSDGALAVAVLGARLAGLSVGVTVPPSMAGLLPPWLDDVPEVRLVTPTGPEALEILVDRAPALRKLIHVVPVGVDLGAAAGARGAHGGPQRFLVLDAGGRSDLGETLRRLAIARGREVETKTAGPDPEPELIGWCDALLADCGGPDLVPGVVRALASGRLVAISGNGESARAAAIAGAPEAVFTAPGLAAEWAFEAAAERSRPAPSSARAGLRTHSLEHAARELVAALPFAPALAERPPQGHLRLPGSRDASRAIGGPLPVSVIIPAYNRGALLPRALASVAAQRPRPPLEVIVIDDASSDDTAQVAEELGARVVRHNRNLGAASARNSGIAAARGEWIAFLDSDDEWLPHHLATLWPRRWGHVLVAGASMRQGATGREVPVSHRFLDERGWTIADPGPLLERNQIPASGNLVSREVLTALDGYDTSLGYAEDFDLWIRILERGKAHVVPIPITRYHRHGGQKSKSEGPRTTQRRIARSYSDRAWWSARLVARREAIAAYAELTQAVRQGNRAVARDRAAYLVRDPRRIVTALRERAERMRQLRRGAAMDADGMPTVAVLPRPAGAQSLHHPRKWPLELALRPPAYAVAWSSTQRAALRIIGVRPLPSPEALEPDAYQHRAT